jgi:hypothetical protein
MACTHNIAPHLRLQIRQSPSSFKSHRAAVGVDISSAHDLAKKQGKLVAAPSALHKLCRKLHRRRAFFRNLQDAVKFATSKTLLHMQRQRSQAKGAAVTCNMPTGMPARRATLRPYDRLLLPRTALYLKPMVFRGAQQ